MVMGKKPSELIPLHPFLQSRTARLHQENVHRHVCARGDYTRS